MSMRDARWLILACLLCFPWVAHAQSVTPETVTIGDLGSISWPAAIAYTVYLLRTWELKIVVSNEDRRQ